MSTFALTEIQHGKMAKLLDETYPQGNILLVDTSALPPELSKAVMDVQNKVDALRDSIRIAEDVLNAPKNYTL